MTMQKQHGSANSDTKLTERRNVEGEYKHSSIQKVQNKEYLIKNACYSVTKYYLCKRNNKRSLLGRKQRSRVARSFLNSYLFSFTNMVTSLFSTSCVLRIIFMSNMRTIELLAPAKNVECGKAAIDHGADAVYIGAQKFGARQMAGNSVESIADLCSYAHRYAAKVHITLNTIIYDEELPDTLALVDALVEAGVDAFLVQDMGLFEEIKKRLPSYIAIHASTQCDTRTLNKAKWLQQQGFNRVVLARELSVEEIKTIHTSLPDLELEVFVHGALCVSFSGVCYASQYCFNRSANRGACSQFCRLPFDLIDNKGLLIKQKSHLLSLKDMNQINNLESLMRAGACSFKIEGRLKDVNYVKNVVSAYSQKLDSIINKYPEEFCRASLGKTKYLFTPNLNKTFNRGYTDYFVKGRQIDIFSPNTPKALGEDVGRVKELRNNSFNVAGTATFTNGDGLCFLHKTIIEGKENIKLEGFRVNRVDGNRLYPYKMPLGLQAGMKLYRNQDQAFEKELSGQTSDRRIPISLYLNGDKDGYTLIANIISENKKKYQVKTKLSFEHQQAKKTQVENIIKQLTKLGNTHYICDTVQIGKEVEQCFIPNSVLSELRRMIVIELNDMIKNIRKQRSYQHYTLKEDKVSILDANSLLYRNMPYLYNISNQKSFNFYNAQGLKYKDMAYELEDKLNRINNKKAGVPNILLMQCRYCIRYSLGYCVKRGGKQPTWCEPLHLRLSDNRQFRIEFDCKDCQMNIFSE